MLLQFQSVTLENKTAKSTGKPFTQATVRGIDLTTGQPVSASFFGNAERGALLQRFQAIQPGQQINMGTEQKGNFLNATSVSPVAGAPLNAAIPNALPPAAGAPPKAQSYTPKAKDPEEGNRIARSVAINNGVLFGIEILKASKDPKKAIDFAVTSALLAAAKFAEFVTTGKTPLLAAGAVEKPSLTIPDGTMPEVPEIPEDDIPF